MHDDEKMGVHFDAVINANALIARRLFTVWWILLRKIKGGATQAESMGRRVGPTGWAVG